MELTFSEALAFFLKEGAAMQLIRQKQMLIFEETKPPDLLVIDCPSPNLKDCLSQEYIEL